MNRRNPVWISPVLFEETTQHNMSHPDFRVGISAVVN